MNLTKLKYCGGAGDEEQFVVVDMSKVFRIDKWNGLKNAKTHNVLYLDLETGVESVGPLDHTLDELMGMIGSDVARRIK